MNLELELRNVSVEETSYKLELKNKKINIILDLFKDLFKSASAIKLLRPEEIFGSINHLGEKVKEEYILVFQDMYISKSNLDHLESGGMKNMVDCVFQGILNKSPIYFGIADTLVQYYNKFQVNDKHMKLLSTDNNETLYRFDMRIPLYNRLTAFDSVCTFCETFKIQVDVSDLSMKHFDDELAYYNTIFESLNVQKGNIEAYIKENDHPFIKNNLIRDLFYHLSSIYMDSGLLAGDDMWEKYYTLSQYLDDEGVRVTAEKLFEMVRISNQSYDKFIAQLVSKYAI